MNVNVSLSTQYALEYYVHVASSTTSLIKVNGTARSVGTLAAGYHHIVITRDNSTYALYIDGSKSATSISAIGNVTSFGIGGSAVTVFTMRAYTYALDLATINVNYKVDAARYNSKTCFRYSRFPEPPYAGRGECSRWSKAPKAAPCAS